MTDMTFRELSRTNKARAEEWHKGGLEEWSPNDWATAMGGEVGEIGLAIDDFLLAMMAEANRCAAHYGRALDLCKKLRRMTHNIDSNNNPPTIEDAIKAIGEEVADGFLYSDLLLQRLGMDTQSTIVRKFNYISEREDLPQRFPDDYVGQW